MGCANSQPETQEERHSGHGGRSGGSHGHLHNEGEVKNPVFTNQPARTEGNVEMAGGDTNGGDAAYSIEDLLSGTRVPSMQPQKRSARRSTDSEYVENLDVFNYTNAVKDGPGGTKAQNIAKMTFETDGVAASFEVGQATRMDKLLRGARAATYSGPMSGGQGIASIEELADRRRSNLEKITLPMLVETDAEGNAQYDFQATHSVAQKLEWREYFSQEGAAPTGRRQSATDQPVDDGSGIQTLEMLLDSGAQEATETESAPPMAGRAGRRASAM
uniref:Uncharacterized protein n=1 Tax=Tetraselmis chuii TaxID=63592 RepID=A0A7S1WZL7_9CHLO|mmetsp:Transcript_16685/g.29772  ORF Transcript_16685/g.29772 Transcript_16685/m.29772 type:complete len:274 (+) Transcript_16685:242-1063(+)